MLVSESLSLYMYTYEYVSVVFKICRGPAHLVWKPGGPVPLRDCEEGLKSSRVGGEQMM